MRLATARPVALAFVMVSLTLGCGGESGVDGGGAAADATVDGSDAATQDHAEYDAPAYPDTAVEAEGGLPTVEVSGQIIRANWVPIENAKVCTLDQPELPCDITDASGDFVVAAPAYGETGLTIVAAGYGSVLVPLQTVGQDDSGWVIGMPTDSYQQDYYDAASVTYPDPQHGFAAVFLGGGNNEGFAGATLVMTPPPGMGPIYDNSGGYPDGSLEATSTWGSAHFAGMPLSVVEVVVGPAGIACTPSFGGWPSMALNAIRFPVAPGFETHVGFYCMP